MADPRRATPKARRKRRSLERRQPRHRGRGQRRRCGAHAITAGAVGTFPRRLGAAKIGGGTIPQRRGAEDGSHVV